MTASAVRAPSGCRRSGTTKRAHRDGVRSPVHDNVVGAHLTGPNAGPKLPLNRRTKTFSRRRKGRNRMTVSSPLVSKFLRECESHTEAFEAAKDEATMTSGQVLSATLFEQGGRTNMSLAMTMNDLARFVHRDSAPARGDLHSKINRPLITDHAKAIN